MRDKLNADIIFNSIAMTRFEKPGIILVTEGDYDSFTLKNHLKDEDVEVIAAGSKPNALEAAQKVLKNNLPGVRFLVDADFDRLLGKKAPSGVVTSLSHDITMDLIVNSIPLLERVIELALLPHRFSDEILSMPDEILEGGFELASCLVSFRIVNEKYSLGIDFKGFPFGTFDSTKPPLVEVAELLLKRSEGVSISLDLLINYARSEVIESKSHRFRLIGDHDFWAALAASARMGGIKKIGKDELEQKFLISVRCSAIMETNWFQELKEWSTQENKKLFNCPSCD